MMENTIEDILKNNIYTKNIFLGVYARNELPLITEFPACFVFNTEDRNQQGEHWLAFYFNKQGYCDFFDSYGLHPRFYDLEEYITKISGTKWSYNMKRLQGLSLYCGLYCIFFIYSKSRNAIRKFYNFFQNNCYNNDKLIFNLIKELKK